MSSIVINIQPAPPVGWILVELYNSRAEVVGVKPASIYTTDQSRRKKMEWMEEIQELDFSSWAFFLKSGEVTGGCGSSSIQ